MVPLLYAEIVGQAFIPAHTTALPAAYHQSVCVVFQHLFSIIRFKNKLIFPAGSVSHSVIQFYYRIILNGYLKNFNVQSGTADYFCLTVLNDFYGVNCVAWEVKNVSYA